MVSGSTGVNDSVGATGIAEIGPLPEYRRRIGLNLLKPDQDQLRAVKRMQDLCEDLLDYKPPEIKMLPGSPLSFAGYLMTGANGGPPLLSPNAWAGKSLIPILIDGMEPDFIGPRGLWIHGEVGTGKTLVMDLFYETLPTPHKRRIHFHHFMQSVYAKINDFHHIDSSTPARFAYSSTTSNTNTNTNVTAAVARELVRTSWCWCFDEFQVTDVGTASVMRMVFAEMFRLGAVVVATSNRKPEDLYRGGFKREMYGPFIDLIKDRCDEFHMRSDIDYRNVMLQESKLKQDTVYYKLDTDKNIQAFIQRVSDLFYGKPVKQESFTVYGREVTVPKAADRVAMFTFEQLCGNNDTKPMGPADYLELCRRYHTIILQSVPVMGLAQKNEARRLITFIDAAYENKVQLIISADDDPENLFVTAPQVSTKDPSSSSSSTKTDWEDDPNESADAVMHREMMGDLLGGISFIETTNPSSSPTANSLAITKLAIFTGEDERFAFRRAVSRIQEMRSEIYQSLEHKPVPLDWSGLVGLRNTPGAIHDRVVGPVATQRGDSENLIDDADGLKEQQGGKRKLLAVAGADAPRGFIPPNLDHESRTRAFNDDFAEEAGFLNYLETHKRLEERGKIFGTAPTTSQSGEGVLEGPILVGVTEGDGNKIEKGKGTPKFRDTHFWGVGAWGSRAGKWGEGVRAFWTNMGDVDEKKKK
ncbi:hypothetical protein HDU76_000367 [Blyttiomyces sp. JEL0837]|nr:hypothetical protein HDU76_000367 [Blyttiomyces sp. JEL0837]